MLVKNPDIIKLPAWAQSHIQSLYSQIENHERLERINDGEQETNVYWNDWLNQANHPIPDSCFIRFTVEGGYIQVSRERDGEGIHISSGTSVLAIKPVTSNGIRVRLEKE